MRTEVSLAAEGDRVAVPSASRRLGAERAAGGVAEPRASAAQRGDAWEGPAAREHRAGATRG
jgi:hypothetical protein